MKVGVPAETWPGETRVAIIPTAVAVLIKAGLEVTVEAGAGVAAGITDDAYRAQGALLASRAEVFRGADIILQVRSTPGDPSLLRPTVMLNLLGDLWREGSPAWRTVLSHPTARLHLYGKRRPSPGRKMGHILILDDDLQAADEVAETIATELEQSVAALPVGRAWT